MSVTPARTKKKREEFNKDVFENAAQHGRARVCLECQKNGYSPKDLKSYLCSNKCRKGHLSFLSKALEHHKERGTGMLCKQCRDTAEKQKKENDAREKDLLQKLRAKDAWQCTCKRKKPAGKRAYAALWENAYHADSCLLTPVMMGERRWDGKNKGVSIEDLMFVAARDPCKW